ncbi:dihydrodipicolinate synthase family protein [Nocardioides sp. L-11A]|uniref:dihydrodipicolinate synthase family protein n=1 Tax=Nocardioides sp. L-11A TaxID=3043848 RepID=UPI00249C9D44|nr:dihydrodipicolinate synthase family protein [Nocardioides sp. L-11A]
MRHAPPISGVIPAHLTPMLADGAIDWTALGDHVRWLAGIDGVRWITTTAHASEVATLDDDERQRLIGAVATSLGDDIGVVAGIYEDGSARAARQARLAVDAGARALLLFPSGTFAGGGPSHPRTQVAHYETIAEAVDVPLIIFKYAVSSPLTMTAATVLEILARIPNVTAVKEWSYDIVEYEDTYRAVKEVRPDVSVLSSFSRSLLSSLVVGSDGVLSAHGSIVGDLQAELWTMVQNRDLDRARDLWDRIYPLAAACYRQPFLDQHNRMKTVLGLLGRIPMGSTFVRAPLTTLPPDELAELERACLAAGLSA